MTYTIAISNEKGGVAKTTTAVSLGAALAENGIKVLICDLDPQANLSLAVGIEPGSSQHTSADVLLDSFPLLQACQKTGISNLDLLPSSPKIETAEQYLPMRLDHLTALKNAVEAAKDMPYEYLIFDCPPALGTITLNALSAARLLIIPTQAEYFSAYALRSMMSLVRRVRDDNNPSLAYRILVTLLDRRNRAHRNIYEQLQATFGEGLFESIIEIDTKLRESPIAGMPITEYKPGSRGSQQYRVLAQELIKYVEEANQQPA